MATDQVDRTVVTLAPPTAAERPDGASQQTARTDRRHTTRTGPGNSDMTRRIVDGTRSPRGSADLAAGPVAH